MQVSKLLVLDEQITMSNALQLVDAAVLNLKMRYTALVLFAAVLCGSFAYLIFKRLNVRGLVSFSSRKGSHCFSHIFS